VYETLGSVIRLAVAHRMIGEVYTSMGKYDKALKHQMKHLGMTFKTVALGISVPPPPPHYFVLCVCTTAAAATTVVTATNFPPPLWVLQSMMFLASVLQFLNRTKNW
jgi:hypothetical protein